MRWYAYALAAGPPGELPDGIGGSAVFAAQQEDLYIVASEWDSAFPPQPEARLLLEHEQVVEAAMESTVLLPFRFGTLGTEAVCRTFVSRFAPQIRERLQAVAGHVEVTLKILDSEPLQRPAGAPRARSGSAYLLHRQREVQAEQARVAQAKALIAAVEQELSPWIAGRHHQVAPGGVTLAAVTHLVPRQAVEPWVRRVTALRAHYPGLDFQASGPWPPYHFAEVTGNADRRDGAHPAPAAER